MARARCRSSSSIFGTVMPGMTRCCRGFGTTFHSPEEIERELKVDHEIAAHANDGSTGFYDIPKSPEEMEKLNKLYHRIDELEKELADVKKLVEENKRVFAVDAPDGESDYHIKEELEEVQHIIEDAAKVENKEEIEKQHEMQKKVKEFHARDPEHDW